MKNIHVLPTDKPSTLIKDLWKNTFFLVGDFATNHTDFKAQHIYITSAEEIKVGDWYYLPRTNSVNKCIEDPTELNLEIRLGVAKIILTTDPDLIKKGVQAIDDTFLEWFVKNPSCEEVYIRIFCCGQIDGKCNPQCFRKSYEIIIPKKEPRILTVEAFNKAKISYKEPKQDEIMERFIANAKQQETLEEKLAKIVSKEPSKFWTESDERARIREEKKQHLIDMMKSDEELGLYEEPKTKCYCGHTTTCDCGPEQYFKDIEFPQQERPETLEEVAEKEASLFYEKGSLDWNKYRQVFIEGAKWQQQRSYSEEDIREAFLAGVDKESYNGINFYEWFEQFKKK